MNKRGISPLIATVLLIGFVIVLGVLFWVFSSGYIKQSLEKGNECNPTDIEQVDVSILETENAERFNFVLKNEGSLTPAGYWVRLTSDNDETKTFVKSKECRPGRECEFTYTYPEGFNNRVSQLEIIPIIVQDEKPCTAVTKSKQATVN